MPQKINVLMLTWEFPPRIIGGISAHTANLSKYLAKQNVKTYVVTCDFPAALDHETQGNVEVFRIKSYQNPAPDFSTWIYLMNLNMQKEAAILTKKIGNIHLFHAHDWLVANASIGLKHMFRKPLITTMHSTEIGRRGELTSKKEKMIHETEWWLTYESWKVICCSRYMIAHVQQAFRLPSDKLIMIPNGVNVQDYRKKRTQVLDNFRLKFASPKEKIVLFIGRLVYEKGVQNLIQAIPNILEETNSKFVIVGEGYMKPQLTQTVKDMKIEHKVLFTGFIDDTTLRRLQICADVCVVPSLFEPFGIVALEAMAAKCPVVVSDTGGLSEIITHGVDGVKTFPNNPESLAWGVKKVLLNKRFAERLRVKAYMKVKDQFNWRKISLQTRKWYDLICKEHSKSLWR